MIITASLPPTAASAGSFRARLYEHAYLTYKSGLNDLTPFPL